MACGRRSRQDRGGANPRGGARRRDASTDGARRHGGSPPRGKILMRIPWEIFALAVAALAAACSATTPSAANLCPTPKTYTADEQSRAARELLALPAPSILAEMIADYARERAELRACRRGW